VTTGPDITNQESPIAAAPELSARRAIGVRPRALAGMVLVACVAAVGWFGTYAWQHRIEPGAVGAAPLKLGDALWRSVVTAARAPGQPCPPRTPVAILYVSRSCVHCEAELERWAHLVRNGAPQLACIGLAIVAPFASTAHTNNWLPPELAPMLLWDRDGSIGRTLDARLVPLLAMVTSTGVVIARSVGESTEAATLQRLVELRRASDTEQGRPVR
jgi:hypothetical protein